MTPELRGFLLALGAGLCTLVGGAFVFCVKKISRLPLTICMALSAGVMLYVSLIEIVVESRHNILLGLTREIDQNRAPKRDAVAYALATTCFFGGWLLTSVMDVLVKFCINSWDLEQSAKKQPPNLPTATVGQPHSPPRGSREAVGSASHVLELATPATTTALPSPTNARHRQRGNGSHQGGSPQNDDEDYEDERSALQVPVGSVSVSGGNFGRRERFRRFWFGEKGFAGGAVLGGGSSEELKSSQSDMWEIAHAEEKFQRDHRRFLKTGVFTALALTIHNIPEGVASFTGSLASQKVGVSVAVAIGIHNIPEGFAVSIPLYFGTGSRWKAVLYSMITGFAEPLGALLCWAAVGKNHDRLTLGLAFGFVAGIMANISIKELLPSALKYDPTNSVTSLCFLCGMLVMAVSLVLFEFAAAAKL